MQPSFVHPALVLCERHCRPVSFRYSASRACDGLCTDCVAECRSPERGRVEQGTEESRRRLDGDGKERARGQAAAELIAYLEQRVLPADRYYTLAVDRHALAADRQLTQIRHVLRDHLDMHGFDEACKKIFSAVQPCVKEPTQAVCVAQINALFNRIDSEHKKEKKIEAV